MTKSFLKVSTNKSFTWGILTQQDSSQKQRNRNVTMAKGVIIALYL